MAETAGDRGALERVLPWLRCPHCHLAMDLTGSAGRGLGGRGLTCLSGHHFDLARQGYVSLLGPYSRTDTGDSAAMVAARVSFLGSGRYSPIASALSQCVTGAQALVEIGAGTGYYLASVLQTLPAASGLALDSSVRAARRAASAHPRLASAVADAWDRLPLADGVADVVLSIFAPRQVAEICRVLMPGGKLIVVTPEPGHLRELISPFRMLTVDPGKADKLVSDFAGLGVIDRRLVRFAMELDPSQVKDLVMMGPSARHLETGAFDTALAALDSLTTVTAAVTVSVLER